MYRIIFLAYTVLFFISLSQGYNESDFVVKVKELISTIRIHRCTCEANQARKDGVCVPAKRNEVPVFYQSEDLLMDVKDFEGVELKKVECEEGFTKVDVGNEFLIYANDSLFKSLLTPDDPQMNYCIEYDVEGNSTILHTEVCSKNPKISTCCPPNYITNEYNECVYKKFTFSPIISKDLHWNNNTLSTVNIVCKEGQVLQKAKIIGPYERGAYLRGTPPGNSLKWFPSYMSKEIPFSSLEYCIRARETNVPDTYTYEAEFCISDPILEQQKLCNNSSCIRKCCPNGYFYSSNHSFCYPCKKTKMSFYFYELLTIRKFKILTGFPLCNDYYSVDLEAEKDTAIKNDGTLSMLDGLNRPATQYCIDDAGESEEDSDLQVLVCLTTEENACSWRWIVGSLCLGISCLFYLATLVVYICISELRKQMIGKCLISELACLIVGSITLIFLQNTDSYTGVMCTFPGTVEHIAILASFFWLNIICYDMWSTLRLMRPADDRRTNITRKFLWYSLYGWGVPLFIGLLRLIVDNVPLDREQYPWLVKTDLGQTHCFFGSNYPKEKWAYLYGPILILLLVNVAFFIHVSLILVKMYEDRNKLLSEEDSEKSGNNFNAKMDRAKLYLKLFIIMGISWLLEIIMWVAVPEADCYSWGIDLVNMAEGIFIFIIFVCKKSIIEKIKSTFEEFLTLRTQSYEVALN